MRAISITTHGGPKVLDLVDIPEPTPGEGEITIDVKYAGVGFVDVLFRRGAFGLTGLPMTPGIEVRGGCVRLAPGRKVWRSGRQWPPF